MMHLISNIDSPCSCVGIHENNLTMHHHWTISRSGPVAAIREERPTIVPPLKDILQME
jgi:hypothetical protein